MPSKEHLKKLAAKWQDNYADLEIITTNSTQSILSLNDAVLDLFQILQATIESLPYNPRNKKKSDLEKEHKRRSEAAKKAHSVKKEVLDELAAEAEKDRIVIMAVKGHKSRNQGGIL